MTILSGDRLDQALFRRRTEPNVKSLHQDLARVVTRVIDKDIPMEHKRNHTRLKKILRGTKWGEYASVYDPKHEMLVINVPFKLKANFLRMYKAGADWYYVKLATNKPPAKASFWATSSAARVAMQRDNLFEWIIRHEFGHSVDKLIQFTNRFAGDPLFGGWVRYQNNTSLLRDILIDHGVNNLKLSNALVRDPDFYRFSEFLTKTDEQTWRWRRVSGFRKNRSRIRSMLSDLNDPMRRHLRKAYTLIDSAIDDPWLVGNQARYNVAAGRRYLFNSQYQEWYSCLDSAFQNRISNYQFCSPSEWFAETYAAWRGQGTAFRDLLIPRRGPNRNQDVVDWFEDELLETGFNQEALIVPVQNNFALGPAPLPQAPNADDLEIDLPASWHFRISANYAIGNPFNPQAVPFPND